MIRAAIRYPYIVLVGALIVLVLGFVSYRDLPADLLPTFKTPAVQIVKFYPGMPPEVMERDITSRLERWTGQSVGIEHQEARSMLGVSIVKDFFREGIAFETAMRCCYSPRWGPSSSRGSMRRNFRSTSGCLPARASSVPS